MAAMFGRLDRGLSFLLSVFFIVIIEKDRAQSFSHVPLDIIGQHAQKHMSSHPILKMMEKRTNFRINCF